MTVVVGLRCCDGWVLGADQKISVQGSHGYQEEKLRLIQGTDWCVTLGYAGYTLTANALRQELVDQLLTLEDREITSEKVRTVTDELLGKLFSNKQYGKWDQLLVGFSKVSENPKLFVQKSPLRSLLPAENFTCLGVGESPLVRYLAASIYSGDITTEVGKNVGIYLVSKAIQYIEGCGDPIDAVVLKNGGAVEYLGDLEIEHRRRVMEYGEGEYLRKIIELGGQ
jgi:20S proteasome alpha/beta subunit